MGIIIESLEPVRQEFEVKVSAAKKRLDAAKAAF
jgi:hypothetical protein